MKTLSRDRGTDIEQLAQEHYEEIEQLNRMHASREAKLRSTQKLMVNDLQAKSTEIDRLKRSLSARDQELAQLRSDLAQKSDDLDIARSSKVELQRQLAHPKHSTAVQERPKDNQHHSVMSENGSASARTQAAISRLINQEIRAHTTAKYAGDVAVHNEQRRFHRFMSVVDEDHTAMRNELYHIRHEIGQLAASSGRHKRTLVREIDELVDWWNTFREGLNETTGAMREEVTMRNCSYVTERENRIDALVELAKFCGVEECLQWGLERMTGE
jgi:predicted  nucleic acid-binding Zn-ribbon protein